MRPRWKTAARAAAFLLLGFLPGKDAGALTIVYSNDVLGELEPCGCRNNPTGGLVRKAVLLQKEGGSELLQLDAGDLLFETSTIPPALTQQSEIQAGYLLRALDLLGHDAVVPGEKDFALGIKKFEQLTGKRKLKFLAANLIRTSNGKPLLPSHAVFSRKTKDGKKIRIAVLGLVGKELAWPSGLRAESPIAAAKREIAGLREKADLVIALTHQGYEQDAKLAQEVAGIDLILGGHSQSFFQDPIMKGKTRIYQSSFRNQHVGLLPVSSPFTGEGHRLVALDAGYEPAADATADTPVAGIRSLVSELKAKVAELNSREDAKLAQATTPDAGSGPKFQTFVRCAECHMKQFDFWRKTPHANALQPLVDASQAKNKQCLQCHTVGLGDPQGFGHVDLLAERKGSAEQPQPIALEDLAQYLKSMHRAKSLDDEVRIVRTEPAMPLQRSLSAITRAWTPVQCENCHQPGREHPFTGTYSKVVQKEACLNCHTAERAPEWYKTGKPDWELIAKKRTLITCPAGELEPAPL